MQFYAVSSYLIGNSPTFQFAGKHTIKKVFLFFFNFIFCKSRENLNEIKETNMEH